MPSTRPLADVLARLDELVDWERRARRALARFDLAPMRDLAARLDDPACGRGVVHVAGSKGKGSVAALVAAGLARAGRQVGRYASPHVERVNERVDVAGKPLGDAALAEALTAALAARGAAVEAGSPGRDATWFDVVTAGALVAFARAGCEWIVAECGLGGRLDSTNVLDGEVCIVTCIEREHTEVLGSSRAEIAREKAGILVPGAAVVCGVPARRAGRPDEAWEVVAARARELGAELVAGPAELERAEEWEGLGLGRRNRILAGLALDALGRRGLCVAAGERVSAALLTDDLCSRAALPGRLERRRAGGVPVVLDGAHVPASVAAVLADPTLADLPPAPVVVLALGRDKDLGGVLKALWGAADRLVCTSVEGGLLLPPGALAERAAALGLPAETVAEPRAALQRALELARQRDGWVLVTGSLYLVGAVRAATGPEATAAC